MSSMTSEHRIFIALRTDSIGRNHRYDPITNLFDRKWWVKVVYWMRFNGRNGGTCLMKFAFISNRRTIARGKRRDKKEESVRSPLAARQKGRDVLRAPLCLLFLIILERLRDDWADGKGRRRSEHRRYNQRKGTRATLFNSLISQNRQ